MLTRRPQKYKEFYVRLIFIIQNTFFKEKFGIIISYIDQYLVFVSFYYLTPLRINCWLNSRDFEPFSDKNWEMGIYFNIPSAQNLKKNDGGKGYNALLSSS